MNTIDISYSNKEFSQQAEKSEVKTFLNKVLSDLNMNNIEFSVSFVSEEEIKELNRDYRNIDSPTDILSFANIDEIDGVNFVSGPRKKKNLGDMVICLPICRNNSDTFNVTFDEELHRLLIHGVLHLSGENHLTNDVSSEPMLQKQEAILQNLYKDNK